MAKGRVTEKSLRVGQTIAIVYKGMRDDIFKMDWDYLKNQNDVNCAKSTFRHDDDFYLFYSKKKAKTKMNKLNREV